MIRAAVIAAALLAAPASAVQIFPATYSMVNGQGDASCGGTGQCWNYWDKKYNGPGAPTTTDSALLTGGVGDLTDGIIAPATYVTTEGYGGDGPYVGWFKNFTPDPTVTFNFANAVTLDTIRIHLDNVIQGGVQAPAAILINGNAYSFTAPAPGTAGFVDFTGLNLAGNTHTVQFVQESGRWVFVSEVEFYANVPEPSQWALMLGGFGLLGAAMRRRKARSAFA